MTHANFSWSYQPTSRAQMDKEDLLRAGLPENDQTAALTRAIDTHASAANVTASPKPRAASMAPCTDAMKAFASSAGVPLQTQPAASYTLLERHGQPAGQILEAPAYGRQLPAESSVSSAASIAQMQNSAVPPAMVRPTSSPRRH